MVLFSLCIFLTSINFISGQFLPNLNILPKLPIPLPTPEEFLETLLNVTANELSDIISHFTFEEILPDHVTFLLYQSDGSIQELKTYSDDHHIDDLSKPIKFIVHGWQSTGEHDFVKDMAKSYHSIGIHNVFGVDWSPHSKRSYLHSARATKKVGEIIARFVMNLIRNDARLLKNVHIIGHSLGAQISGFAGNYIRQLTNGQMVHRITGLDAASPLFDFPFRLPDDSRITKDDAHYVDGIHTNIGFFGVIEPFGHADYYVDFGGPIQPGCLNINMFSALACSHGKSHDIYNMTITSKSYRATSCGNPLRALANLCLRNRKEVMGEHSTTKARGIFFIYIDGENRPADQRTFTTPLGRIPGVGKLRK